MYEIAYWIYVMVLLTQQVPYMCRAALIPDFIDTSIKYQVLLLNSIHKYGYRYRYMETLWNAVIIFHSFSLKN